MDIKTVIIFDKKDDDGEIRLAKFLAELTRQGVTFTVRADGFAYEVVLTGGY